MHTVNKKYNDIFKIGDIVRIHLKKGIYDKENYNYWKELNKISQIIPGKYLNKYKLIDTDGNPLKKLYWNKEIIKSNNPIFSNTKIDDYIIRNKQENKQERF